MTHSLDIDTIVVNEPSILYEVRSARKLQRDAFDSNSENANLEYAICILSEFRCFGHCIIPNHKYPVLLQLDMVK